MYPELQKPSTVYLASPFVGGTTHLKEKGALRQWSHTRSSLRQNEPKQAEQENRTVERGLLNFREPALFR